MRPPDVPVPNDPPDDIRTERWKMTKSVTATSSVSGTLAESGTLSETLSGGKVIGVC
jgi:hypothetical protein